MKSTVEECHEGLQHHLHSRCYASAKSCAESLNKLLHEISSTKSSQYVAQLHTLTTLGFVPILSSPPDTSDANVIQSIFALVHVLAATYKRDFYPSASLLARYAVMHSTNPSHIVASIAQEALHSMTLYSSYNVEKVLNASRDVNFSFHLAMQIPLMVTYWQPEQILPHHDQFIDSIGRCLFDVGFLTRSYGYIALSCLYDFQLEFAEHPTPISWYLAGLTALNVSEITQQLPVTMLARDLLADSCNQSESNDSSVKSCDQGSSMLQTFLTQIHDQHDWTSTQEKLYLNRTLRRAHPPLLEVANLRRRTIEKALGIAQNSNSDGLYPEC